MLRCSVKTPFVLFSKRTKRQQIPSPIRSPLSGKSLLSTSHPRSLRMHGYPFPLPTQKTALASLAFSSTNDSGDLAEAFPTLCSLLCISWKSSYFPRTKLWVCKSFTNVHVLCVCLRMCLISVHAFLTPQSASTPCNSHSNPMKKVKV